MPQEVEEEILHLRRTYHFGPVQIAWYLERYHGIRVSSSGVCRALLRNGLSRLPGNCRRRSIVSLRYEKQVPGHHVQLDAKFLQFKGTDGRRLKRYQFTAIDDVTRIRALRIYERRNQESAVDFLDHVVERFPFRWILFIGAYSTTATRGRHGSTGTARTSACVTSESSPASRT